MMKWYWKLLFLILFMNAGTSLFAQFPNQCKTSDIPNTAPGLCQQELFDPVCGCDSVTYRHPCDATLINNVQFYTEGICVNRPFALDIYPIPVTQTSPLRMAIETLPNFNLGFAVFIYDSYGVLRLQRNVPPTSRYDWSINASSLKLGIYVALVIETNSGFAVSKKFVVSSI